MARRSSLVNCILSGVLSLVTLARSADAQCRYIPEDAGWPNQTVWSQLNDTVQGRLLATVPQASVCHTTPYKNYDNSACAALRTGSSWSMAQTYELKPAEFMSPYYQNQSCDPFSDPSMPCELGNHAAYSINVTGADDVVVGIRFAEENNIRLVVKATGHDFNGKSTGKGALSLWMFNLKTTGIIRDYVSETYSGPAIKLGAGVITGEAEIAAANAGYRVVGGECGSVSHAGGFSQGGGHSLLNSAYGMAADTALEWEVITASGEHLVATPEQNADLYWALSGGGGGTYGVVLSMVAKIYPDGPFASGALAFTLDEGAGGNESVFWEAVELWFSQLPHLVADNNTIQYVIQNSTFAVLGINMPDQDDSAARSLVASYLAELDRLNIKYSFSSKNSATYLEYLAGYLGPLPYGPQPTSTILSSRLIPRSAVLDSTANTKLVTAYRETVGDGTFLVGCSAMSVANTTHPENAVLPAWRDAIAICNVNAYWDFTAPLEVNHAVQDELMHVHTPAIEAATPNSGVYLNEMYPEYQGDWKQEMYGVNYERLLEIKHKYDPDHLFYGHFAVGSDEYTIDGAGRLCRNRGQEDQGSHFHSYKQ